MSTRQPPPTAALPPLAGAAIHDERSSLAATLDTLAASGGATLRRLSDARLLAAWDLMTGELLDPRSALRAELEPWLATAARLSTAGLQAVLHAVAQPLRGDAARALFVAARARPASAAATPALVILPANLPGLALQTLLPALARRRPVLFKSPSAEPYLAPALLRALARAEPELAVAYAAMVWRGGDSRLESIALAACSPVVAYGDRPAIEALTRRTRRDESEVIAFGPAFSIAVWHRAPTADEIAGLARDVAVGDQRGCLSIHVVLTTVAADAGARRLAAALAELARGALPPGPVDPAVAAAARQTLDEAAARGLACYGALADGAVVIEPAQVSPSPGQRLVRVVPVRDLDQVLALLQPWRDRLQGAAVLAGAPVEFATALAGLGVHRVAAPGELQHAGATWRNAGIDLLAVF